MKKYMNAQVIRSTCYGRVIQVNVPMRFYWDEDGEFDGMEFGKFKKKLNKYQSALIYEVLDVFTCPRNVRACEERKRNNNVKLPIPEIFTKAFEETKEKKDGHLG